MSALPYSRYAACTIFRYAAINIPHRFLSERPRFPDTRCIIMDWRMGWLKGQDEALCNLNNQIDTIAFRTHGAAQPALFARAIAQIQQRGKTIEALFVQKRPLNECLKRDFPLTSHIPMGAKLTQLGIRLWANRFSRLSQEHHLTIRIYAINPGPK